MQPWGKLKGPGLIEVDAERMVGEQLMVLSHEHGFSALRGIRVKGEVPERADRCPNLTINLDEHRLVSPNRRRCVERSNSTFVTGR